MAGIGSDASFAVAARHLFRHVHDPHALRKNPLVRHFFEAPSKGATRTADERVALDRIHRLIRQGTERCRDADLAAGMEERAVRQHTIVIRQCLEGRSVQEVAQLLGISSAHCYRERREICQRVAQYIRDCDDAPTLEYLPQLDEFHCLLDRTVHRAGLGDIAATFRECDDLVRAAPSIPEKVEALRVNSSIAIEFGHLDRAEKAYAQARAYHMQDIDQESPAHNFARACIELTRCDLAYYRADTARALRMAQRAVSRLAPLRSNAPVHVRTLYVEALAELGTMFAGLGDLDRGHEYFADAEASLGDARTAPVGLRTSIVVAVWKLRNHLLMSSKTCYPVSQRIRGLANAFEQAYSSGLLTQAIAALVALTECYAFAGNDDNALQAGRSAIRLARQQSSDRTRTQTAIQIAWDLLFTRHVDQAFALLPDAEELTVCDGYHLELNSCLAAAYALRLEHFNDAWRLTQNAGEHPGYAVLAIRKRLIAAAAAYELERQRDARNLIEEAIPAAERFGVAPVLRDAYSVAARITGDARFEHRADEVRRLLSA